MSTPSIHDGIVLERAGLFLPWGAAMDAFADSAEVMGDRHRWSGESVLGGVGATVDVFPHIVSQAVLWLDLDEGYHAARDNDAVITVHRAGVDALARALGPPTTYHSDRSTRFRRRRSVYPSALWDLGGIRVSRRVGDKNGMTWRTEIIRVLP